MNISLFKSIKEKSKFIFIFLGIVSMMSLGGAQSAYAAQYHAVGNGGVDWISEVGYFYRVLNSCGPSIFIPTNTGAEYWSFIANHPGCASIAQAWTFGVSRQGGDYGFYCQGGEPRFNVALGQPIIFNNVCAYGWRIGDGSRCRRADDTEIYDSNRCTITRAGDGLDDNGNWWGSNWQANCGTAPADLYYCIIWPEPE